MVNGKTINSLNGYGTAFRFITPILITIIGFLTVYMIHGIDSKIDKMDLHFTNHLQHHQDLEVGYERRLTSIEVKIK